MKGPQRVKKGMRGQGSIKDQAGIARGPQISKTMNLGVLMRKYKDIEEVLFPYTSSVGLVYEDMDCTIEEFSDMTGADIEELLADIIEVIRRR